MTDEGPKKVTAKDGHVYHKSATANATEAPTNEFTVQNATKVEGLTPEQIDFVTIVHYEFSLHGELPSKALLKEEYGYKKAELVELYQTPKVKQALQARGIELTAANLSPVGIGVEKPQRPLPKVTPLQAVVANVMLDLVDSRSEKKKLADHGVTTMQYQSWLQDDKFRNYMELRVERMVGNSQHEAMLGLIDSMRSGNMKATELYLTLTGKLAPKTSGGAPTGQADLQGIMVRVVEIIMTEVEDPATVERIGNRLKALVMGGQVAGVLPTSAPIIEEPEIAAPREITPSVAKLMSQGSGVNV